MPRYVVERTFPDGLNVPVDSIGASAGDTSVKRKPPDQLNKEG